MMQNNATAKKLIDHDFRERKSWRENNPLGHIEESSSISSRAMPAAILIEASSAISQPTTEPKGAKVLLLLTTKEICLQLSKQHHCP